MSAREKFNLGRLLRAGALLAAALAFASASACGGGGGGSGSSSSSGGGNNPPPQVAAYSLSATSVSQTRSVLDVSPVYSEITVTIPDAAAVPFGIGGRYSNTALASVGFDPATLRLAIYFKVPAGIAPGSYTDTITIGVCENAGCTTQRAGTSRTITASYTVTPATLPSYTLSASTINVTALAGDVTTSAPLEVFLSETNAAPFTTSGHSTSTTTTGVYSVEYSATSFAPLRFLIHLKAPNSLTPGTHTDTVTVRMCLYFDYGCQNPLSVTPSTITVNYTITDTVSGPAGYTSRLSAALANDAAWDATRGVLYLSVPGDAPERAATITEFNPATGAFGASVPAGAEPNLLAISDDDQFLYVADKALGEIRRFKLGPLAPDITIPLGNDTQHPSAYPHVAWDLQVAPAQPRVIAVKRQIVQFSPGDRGVVVFDDAVARPTVWGGAGGYLQWGADATRLHTNSQIATVDASGVSLLSTYPGVSGHISLVGGRMFGDFGQVTDIATATSLGPIVLDGYYENIASDSTLGRVYLLTRARAGYGNAQIESYDAATLTRIGIGRLPAFQIQSNRVARATRFGPNGLAIVTSSHHVVLVTGPLIAP
jgi:hypothetical protein